MMSFSFANDLSTEMICITFTYLQFSPRDIIERGVGVSHVTVPYRSHERHIYCPLVAVLNEIAS